MALYSSQMLVHILFKTSVESDSGAFEMYIKLKNHKTEDCLEFPSCKCEAMLPPSLQLPC